MLKLKLPFNFVDSTNFSVGTLECISWHGIIKIGGFLGDFGSNCNISKLVETDFDRNVNCKLITRMEKEYLD